ncbi:MAG: DMT family transporter [Candidatus Zixiibacteriota bacterium]|nr:MAG: DMT family transporter [candidate division Zixibacteria bacterium]
MNTHEKKSRLLLYSAILLHQVLTAVAFPVAKLGLNYVEPFTLAFMRFTLASTIFIPVLFWLKAYRVITKRDHLTIFILGLVLIPVNQTVFLVGQSMTTASHSSLLFAAIPIFIYILAIIFLGEKMTFRRTAGIAIATGGVYMILSGEGVELGASSLLGDALVLVAVLAWAVAAIMAKPLIVKYGAFRVTGMALVYGSLVYAPFGLYKTIQFQFDGVPWQGWFSALYLAFVVSIIAYFLWYWVLKYMEASRVAILQNIQPIIATSVAMAMLSETISEYFVVGGIIVITGVILTELK